MAKTLNFSMGVNRFALSPVKLERKKLYGYTETQAIDTEGRICQQAGIDSNGMTIVPKGATKVGKEAVFAVCDSRRKLEITLSEGERLATIRRQSDCAFMRSALATVSVNQWDSLCPQQTRERVWVITGNILQGIAVANRFGANLHSAKKKRLAQSKGHGRLICYTDEHNHLCHGYLMPRIFRPADISLAS